MRIRESDLSAIARLWKELGEFTPSQTPAALSHCLAGLARCIGASNALWVGTHRNDDASWRHLADVMLIQPNGYRRRHAELMRHVNAGDLDPQTRAMLARAGTTRALLRPQLVDDAEWQQSWLYNDLLRPFAIEDRLMSAKTLDTCRESYIGLDRERGDKPFGERERDMLALFLAGIPAFHWNVLLSYGGTAPDARLTARERDVLHLLLTDASEREIAVALDLTHRTTHQHVVTVLRKFGVKGRVGLMAYWLRMNAMKQ